MENNIKITTELILQIIDKFGVGNFILIMFVLMIFINLPNIISNILNFLKGRKPDSTIEDIKKLLVLVDNNIKKFDDNLTIYDKKLDDQTKEIKALIAIVDLIHSSIEKGLEEISEENSMITYSLERLSTATESISKIMRNVISEEDIIKIITFFLGIEDSLKINIIKKVMENLDNFDNKIDDSIAEDLKNELNSIWSDFKHKTRELKAPIDMTSFLEEKEREFWVDGGFFFEILKTFKSNNLDKSRKKEIISKKINIEIRKIHNDFVYRLREKNKN